MKILFLLVTFPVISRTLGGTGCYHPKPCSYFILVIACEEAEKGVGLILMAPEEGQECDRGRTSASQSSSAQVLCR